MNPTNVSECETLLKDKEAPNIAGIVAAKSATNLNDGFNLVILVSYEANFLWISLVIACTDSDPLHRVMKKDEKKSPIVSDE